MKNLTHLFLLITTVIFTISCSNDGGSSKLDLIEGSVPDIVKSSTSEAYFDYNLIQNDEDVEVIFDAKIAQGNPSKTDIIAVYQTADEETYDAILFENVKLPQTFSITMSSIIDSFEELSSFSDIQLGDALVISTRFTLNNNAVINIINDDGSSNVSSNIQTSPLYTTKISYPVSCPSALGGTYTVISNGENTDGQPPAVNLPYEVTLTDNGGGSYTISDFSSGVYIFWYSIYGITFEQEGEFVDICNTISGTFTDAWGDSFPVTGTVNEDGTISLYWQNPYGDYADSVLTLKQ